MARRSVDANFSNLPAPLSESEKSMLVDDLQEFGDENMVHHGQQTSIRRLLIESHIELVISIAIRYNRNDLHELVSEGLLALTHAVNKFAQRELENRNFSGYVNVTVHRALQRFIRSDAIIPVKPDAYRAGVRTAVRNGFANISKASPDTTPEIAVKDALDHATKGKNQKIVGQCLLEGGYKLKDMAKLCNVSVPRISQIKKEVVANFTKVWDA